MSIFRWIFAFVGLMRARLWGALTGYWLGYMLDSFLAQIFFKPADHAKDFTYSYDRQDTFLRPLMTVFIHVIHADGKIMHSEMEYARNFLRVNYGPSIAEAGSQMLLSIFQEKKRVDEGTWLRMLSDSCARLAVQLSQPQRIQLIQVLLQIAAADGSVKDVELQGIRLLAVNLGLNADIVDNLTGTSRRTYSSSDDYRILGITPDVTDDEVRQAYRKLALANHPDRVASLGEAAKAQAEEKFRHITEAKERIFKARGMK